MKCPLITAGFWADPESAGKDAIDCLKEECAWWDRGQEKCAILLLGQEAFWLKEQAIQIRDKMPHEEQFRR